LVLWEVASGQERGRFPKIRNPGCLAFSPNGNLLAAGGYGGNQGVRLLHLASGRDVGCLTGFNDFINSLAFSPDGSRLACAGFSNTALICDVAALTADKVPLAEKPTAKDLDTLWDDLAGGDGAKAFRAIARLADFPAESVPFLRQKVKLIGDSEDKRFASLIADLDDNSFEVREKASAALEKLGKKAAAALTRTAEKSDSMEARVRAQRLLETLKEAKLASPEVVGVRAVEVLETSDAPTAHELLKELAKGNPDAALTREAKAAIKRFAARKMP
jgi:hypothetical protein